MAYAPSARPIDRSERPNYVIWETTLQCDQACLHCGSRAGRPRLDELSRQERLDLIAQLAALGVLELTLTGGETYLRDDWLDVVREVRRQGMQCTMVTAGRGVTAELASAAAEAGLQGVSVSVDGCEATHNRLRNWAGSHQAAMRALDCFREAGIKVSANTQINRLTLPDLPLVLETIADKSTYAWQLQLTFAMGRAADAPEVLLQPYDVLALFEALPPLIARCEQLGVRFYPADNIGYFGPQESLLRGALPCGHYEACGAGRDVLGVEADGTVKPCASLPTVAYKAGNMRERTLVDIWERALPMRFARDLTVDDLWGYCRSCYYAETCLAGCTSVSFVLFGKPGNNPYCHHRALEMQKRGKRERLVPRKPAPGLPFDWGELELIIEDSGR